MAHQLDIGGRQWEVASAKDLAMILEALRACGEHAETLQWEALMQLDWRLMEIVKSWKGLQDCFKHLSDRNRFTLMLKIGDTLPEVVADAERLGNLLAGIAGEKNKVQLLKTLRKKGLSRLVRSAQDLAFALEWLYEEAERAFLETVGPDFVAGLVRDARDAGDALRFATAENRGRFAETIGIGRLRAMGSESAEDFFLVLRVLPPEQAADYLSGFARADLKALIGDDRAFRRGLRSLPDAQENLLRSFFGLPPAETDAA